MSTPLNCDEEWVYITILPASVQNITNGMDDYNQTYINTPITTTITTGVRANDTDVEGHPQSITPINRTISGKGTLSLGSDGSYTFTPAMGFSGPVDFPYLVCDNQNPRACDSATLHLLVDPNIAVGNIGDFVWHDTNGDGLQTPGEPGIPNIIVELYGESGSLEATTVTDNAGRYTFTNVLASKYYIKFAAPDEWTATIPNAGDDNRDSDVTGSRGKNTTDVFTLVAGSVTNNIDAGFYRCGKIGMTVWYDTNKNDIRDDIENGINGLRVKLFKIVNGAPVYQGFVYSGHKPGTPSDDGWAEFCVAPGQYYLLVEAPPNGLVRARPFIGTDKNRDSDVNNANGTNTTPTFTIQSGVDKLDLGSGWYPQAQAGNLVWIDENQNGLQEAEEPRAAGVKVQVYDITNNEMLGEDITDIQGTYHIDYLEKRDVYFRFTPPVGYSATVPNQGDNAQNSDVDHSMGLNTTNMISMIPDVYNKNIDFGIVNGVLPVSWLSINVSKEGKFHRLDWVTTAEVNLDHYIVERMAADEKEFSEISHKIVPIGTLSASKNYYNYQDGDIDRIGIYTYRVKQIDVDGKFTYSKQVQISVNSEGNISIYPNPTNQLVNIAFEVNAKTDLNIQLLNSEGKFVKQLLPNTTIERGSYSQAFDLTGIAPGVYSVFIHKEGKQEYQKLVILE
jgi:hypothetical protein